MWQLEARRESAPPSQSPCRKSSRTLLQMRKNLVLYSLLNGWPAIRFSVFWLIFTFCLPSDFCLPSAFYLPFVCLLPFTAFCLLLPSISYTFSSICLFTAPSFPYSHPDKTWRQEKYPSDSSKKILALSRASPPSTYSPFFGSVQFTNKLILVFLIFNELILTLIHKSF